jgi:hypothetical protein
MSLFTNRAVTTEWKAERTYICSSSTIWGRSSWTSEVKTWQMTDSHFGINLSPTFNVCAVPSPTNETDHSANNERVPSKLRPRRHIDLRCALWNDTECEDNNWLSRKRVHGNQLLGFWDAIATISRDLRVADRSRKFSFVVLRKNTSELTKWEIVKCERDRLLVICLGFEAIFLWNWQYVLNYSWNMVSKRGYRYGHLPISQQPFLSDFSKHINRKLKTLRPSFQCTQFSRLTQFWAQGVTHMSELMIRHIDPSSHYNFKPDSNVIDLTKFQCQKQWLIHDFHRYGNLESHHTPWTKVKFIMLAHLIQTEKKSVSRDIADIALKNRESLSVEYKWVSTMCQECPRFCQALISPNTCSILRDI